MRKVIIFSYIVIILISSGLIGFSTSYYSKKSVEEMGRQLSGEISHRVQDQVFAFLETPHLLNMMHINSFNLGFLNPENVAAQEKYYWRQIQNFKQISHTFFSNSLGDFVGSRIIGSDLYGIMIGDESTDQNTNYHYYSADDSGERLTLQLKRPKSDPRLRPWYTAAEISGEPVWSPIYTTTDSNLLGISASAPVYNQAGTLEGVVGSNYVFAGINNFLISIEAGKTGEVYIMEEDGLIISTSTLFPNSHMVEGNSTRIPASDHESQLVRNSFNYITDQKTSFADLDIIHAVIEDKDYFIQRTSLLDSRGLDWLVVIVLPYEDFVGQINVNNRNSMIIIFISIFTAIVIAFLNINWILFPVKKLNQLAIDITNNHWDNRIEIVRNDEIGQLASSFNIMIDYVNSLLRDSHNHIDDLELEIEQRKKVEEALSRTESYVSAIIDSMPSMLIGVNHSNEITLWNKSAATLMGISSQKAMGMYFSDLFPQFLKNIQMAIEEHKTLHFSFNRNNKIQDISIYPVISPSVEEFVIRIDDVTEKAHMQEIMIHNERIVSLGGLAAGMAHEINNPLGGILQTVGVLNNRLNNSEIPANKKAAEKVGTSMDIIKDYLLERDIPRMFESITESGKRASDIVKNMLYFARKSEGDFSTHSLEDILGKTFILAATEYDLKNNYDFKSIRIIKEFDENIPPVLCEESKIIQVLLNLLRNGSQAMHEGKVSDPLFIIRLKHEKEIGDYVVLEIEDNGPGMDNETRKRIFEPFFTTKLVGSGTGLGLSVSYFIITKIHKGELIVKSSPGNGTVFIVKLPL